MKMKLIFLDIFIHTILAFILPYTLLFISMCIYFIGGVLDYISTPDIAGEEWVIFLLVPPTLFMLIFIFLILVPGNRFIYQRLHVSKLSYWIFNLSVFIIAFFVILLNFDPLNFLGKFAELMQEIF